MTDWACDNFVRWAHALGFIAHDGKTDTFPVTSEGIAYVGQPATKGVNALLEAAMLSYAPAVRVLRLLEQGRHLTKFEIGRDLGFVGEKGFTNYPQEILIQALHSASPADRSDMLSDCEGSADKYARGIAAWLTKLGWVRRTSKDVSFTLGKQTFTATIPPSYVLTASGLDALGKAEGRSRHAVTPKNIYYEMLATGNQQDRTYLRTRRALLLESLNGGAKRTMAQLLAHTAGQSVVTDAATVNDDLEGLKRIGLNIVSPAPDVYSLKDPIRYLVIPRAAVPTPTQNQQLKAQLRPLLQNVPHTYLDLLDLAFDGSSNRMFEARSMALLIDAGFVGGQLGGSDKPDDAFWTNTGNNDYALIVDAKAYAGGFSCTASSRDEMSRYVLENIDRPAVHPTKWWQAFPQSLTPLTDFRFLFVSGAFTRGFAPPIRPSECRGAEHSRRGNNRRNPFALR